MILDLTINVANVIAILAALGAGGAAFIRLQSQHYSLVARVRVLEKRWEKETDILVAHGQALARIEAQLGIIMQRCPACQLSRGGKE